MRQGFLEGVWRRQRPSCAKISSKQFTELTILNVGFLVLKQPLSAPINLNLGTLRLVQLPPPRLKERQNQSRVMLSGTKAQACAPLFGALARCALDLGAWPRYKGPMGPDLTALGPGCEDKSEQARRTRPGCSCLEILVQPLKFFPGLWTTCCLLTHFGPQCLFWNSRPAAIFIRVWQTQKQNLNTGRTGPLKTCL